MRVGRLVLYARRPRFLAKKTNFLSTYGVNASAPETGPTPASVPPASSAQPVTTPPLVTKVAKPAIGNVAASSLATRPSSAQTAPKSEPFAFADFTWLDGNARTKTLAFDTKFFTPEIRVDADYIYDFHHPKDDTIGGPREVFR